MELHKQVMLFVSCLSLFILICACVGYISITWGNTNFLVVLLLLTIILILGVFVIQFVSDKNSCGTGKHI